MWQAVLASDAFIGAQQLRSFILTDVLFILDTLEGSRESSDLVAVELYVLVPIPTLMLMDHSENYPNFSLKASFVHWLVAYHDLKKH